MVDDGSTDNTQELLSEFYPSVQIIEQRNSGVSAARNAGVKVAAGEWLAFLDSDDEWLPDKIEKQMTAASDNPDYKLIHCDEIWIRNGVRVNAMDKHEKFGGFIFDKCLPRCVISPSATIIQRDLFDEIGLFDETMPACEDYDLWLRICSRYPVLYLEEKLLRKYGGHEDQLSRKHWGMDRFRVEALDRIIRAGSLDKAQLSSARSMLITKCNILLAGAEKHGNVELKNKIDTILSTHS